MSFGQQPSGQFGFGNGTPQQASGFSNSFGFGGSSNTSQSQGGQRGGRSTSKRGGLGQSGRGRGRGRGRGSYSNRGRGGGGGEGGSYTPYTYSRGGRGGGGGNNHSNRFGRGGNKFGSQTTTTSSSKHASPQNTSSGFGFGSNRNTSPSQDTNTSTGFGFGSPPQQQQQQQAFNQQTSSHQGGSQGFHSGFQNVGVGSGSGSGGQSGHQNNTKFRSGFNSNSQQHQSAAAPSSSFSFMSHVGGAAPTPPVQAVGGGGGFTQSSMNSPSTKVFGSGSGSGGSSLFQKTSPNEKNFGSSTGFGGGSKQKNTTTKSFGFGGGKQQSKGFAFGSNKGGDAAPTTAKEGFRSPAATSPTPASASTWKRTSGEKAKLAGSSVKSEKNNSRSFTWVRKPDAAAIPPTITSSKKKRGGETQEGRPKESEMERMKREAISQMPTFAGGSGSGSSSKPKPKPMVKKKPTTSNQPKGEGILERLKREAINSMPKFAGAGGSKQPSPSSSSRPKAAAPKPSKVAQTQPTPQRYVRQAASSGNPSGSSNITQPLEEEDADRIVGTCEMMCPDAELERRFRTNDFDELELPNPDYPGMSVEDLSVKRFARTITEEDRQPDRLRTRNAIQRTMKHLLGLMDSTQTTFEKVHRFLWDRYRAIRTDLSIQHIKDEFAVACYEEMIRFHIIAEHELCEETATVNNPHGFNSHLNVEQMYKCLTSLFTLYDELAKAGRPCPHESEFRAYYVLLTIDTHGKYRRDKSAHSFALSKMRPEILQSDFVQFAVQLNCLYHEGNFVKFFSLVRKSPFLVACILHAYFDPVRERAVLLLAQGVYGRNRTLPVEDVQQMLLMDTVGDAASLCQDHGLRVEEAEEGIVVYVGQKNFQEQENASLRKCSHFISSKRSARKYADCCAEPSVITPDLLPRQRRGMGSRTSVNNVLPRATSSFNSVQKKSPVQVKSPVRRQSLTDTNLGNTGTKTSLEAFADFGGNTTTAAMNQNAKQNLEGPVKEDIAAPASPMFGTSAPPVVQPMISSNGNIQIQQDTPKRRREQSISPPMSALQSHSKKMPRAELNSGSASPLAQPELQTSVGNSGAIYGYEANMAAMAKDEDDKLRERQALLQKEEMARKEEIARQEAEQLERERQEILRRQKEEQLRREKEYRIVQLEMKLKLMFVDHVYRRLLAKHYANLWRNNAALIVAKREKEERTLQALKQCNLTTSFTKVAPYAYGQQGGEDDGLTIGRRGEDATGSFLDLPDLLSQCLQRGAQLPTLDHTIYWKVMVFQDPLVSKSTLAQDLVAQLEMASHWTRQNLSSHKESQLEWQSSILHLNTYSVQVADRLQYGDVMANICIMNALTCDFEIQDSGQGGLHPKLFGTSSAIFFVVPDKIKDQLDRLEKVLSCFPHPSSIPLVLYLCGGGQTKEAMMHLEKFSGKFKARWIRVDELHPSRAQLGEAFDFLATCSSRTPVVLRKAVPSETLMDEFTAALKAVRDMSTFVNINGVVKLLNGIVESYAHNLLQSIDQVQQHGFPAQEWDSVEPVVREAEYMQRAKESYYAILSLKLPEDIQDRGMLESCLSKVIAVRDQPGGNEIGVVVSSLYDYYAKLVANVQALHRRLHLLDKRSLSKAEMMSLCSGKKPEVSFPADIQVPAVMQPNVSPVSNGEDDEGKVLIQAKGFGGGQINSEDKELDDLVSANKENSNNFQQWLVREISSGDFLGI